ncbi:helix-turn-helix domain-containing protein [Mucilaginibacter pedocola]|uniref:AraC family transcriptional regulator n=1 Tax=Mucilaginibacter pedocola TaxID=1792845 RepID=A0A1S9P6H8_9SPHI|nr:helix-turn-helix domain-containing protein [Mucilaginibacter pedocola]OOQ56549.1 AraC family transcriptional regulator [Mucilaginibacter pedocola]
MYHQEFTPPAQLSQAIKCFWYTCRDAVEGQPGFEVVPDGYAEIVFCFGALHLQAEDGSLRPLPPVFMMGLLGAPVTFYTEGVFEVIGIRCYPWAVSGLLNLRAGGGGLQPLEHPIATLWPTLAKLVAEKKIDEAVKIVNNYFAEWQVNYDNILNKASAAMRTANGSLSVKGVAEAAHATVRTLERRFKASAGHSVKDVSALMRFEQVRNRLWTDPDAHLATLAAELGYSDQPHLSREFKRYSGTSPAAFARKAKQERVFFSDNLVAFV